jgi:hypothetical protein
MMRPAVRLVARSGNRATTETLRGIQRIILLVLSPAGGTGLEIVIVRGYRLRSFQQVMDEKQESRMMATI